MRLFYIIYITSLTNIVFANTSSSKIYHSIEKLHSLKRVLYIAAHPDDENTRALAWFSLHHKAETAYLSLTRGDGGQNLIGTELSDELGVLRTQELLSARKYDGATQFFSRAVDFGYSKTSKESFELWDKEEILKDVVLVIRKFKPQYIITRFPPDKRAGHGHHSASALIAMEAFDKAADPNYLPDQVRTYGTWQTTSLYWNTSVWWDKELPQKALNNDSIISENIGIYDQLLGKSYNEIGTIARSQHKCQGFGAILERGERIEYFKHLKGVKIKNHFFENHKLNWNELTNKKTEKQFNKLFKTFDFKKPENNVELLFRIRSSLELLTDSFFKNEKLNRCNQIIFDCLGLHIEALVDDYAATFNQKIKVNLNCLNRSSKQIKLTEFNLILPKNKTIEQKITFNTPSALSTPYWLKNNYTYLFQIDAPELIGQAEREPISYLLKLNIEGRHLELNIPIIYKWRDPSFGERQRNIAITPEFTVNIENKTIISRINQSQKIKFKVHSFTDNLNNEINILAPKGWLLSKSKFEININEKHAEKWIELELKATEKAEKGYLVLLDNQNDTIYNFKEIKYDHISTQTIFKKSKLNCVPLNLEIKKGNVAYITELDDNVAIAISQMGFNVDIFNVKDIKMIDLNKYQSIVLGIRVYNKAPELHNFDQLLFDYVNQGGNLIMQYNTTSRSNSNKKYGPIPFEISRYRVTNEHSTVKFISPNHQILNAPNQIVKNDFENWVQERGLYFANNWNNQFTPILSWSDDGEDDLKGALIVTKYGKGQFIYTGISFFRELPAGVEGAYKLMANMLSYIAQP